MAIKISSNRKGMFFTIATIGFVLIFLFYFTIPQFEKEAQRMQVIEKRVITMDNFVDDVERDIRRGVYISSFRAILALEEEVVQSGDFLDDIDKMMLEAMLNGTINATTKTMMTGATFTNWIQKIRYEASKMEMELNISVLDVQVYQVDPWKVSVGVNCTIQLTDTTKVANFAYDTFIESNISINGFEDPLYIVNGYGRLTNLVNASPYEGNFSYNQAGSYNVDHLLDHISKGYYVANPDAPNFLMRFENDLGTSPFGIESLLNLSLFFKQDLPIEDLSIVDHVYWSGASTNDFRINNTPNWVKIDEDHIDRYNLSQVAYQE